jgi:hypothetical protein
MKKLGVLLLLAAGISPALAVDQNAPVPPPAAPAAKPVPVKAVAPRAIAPRALPVKAPVPVLPSIPTGWYLDIEGTGSVLKPGGGVQTLAPAGAGVTIGGGYDYIASNVILGVYGNVGWVNVRGTATCELMPCSSGNTWEGEIGGRLGITFANLNTALGNNSVFQNINGKLVMPLQPVHPLDTAVVYWKAGAVFQEIQASVAGVNDSRVDIGLRTGPGIEIPVWASSSGGGTAAWRTEADITKFTQSICNGCPLPTGRPLEYGGKTGIVYKF